jgi:exopolysaccharide biosynthesis protein
MPEDALFTVRTRRQTTVDFFNDLLQKEHHPMVAAINGAPWKPWVAPWNHPFADCMGLLISDGDVVLPSNGIKPSLIIFNDGRAEMKLLKPDTDLSGIRHAISGFFFALKKGVPVGNKKNTAPRTGIGLSADRRYMYWVVADGRQENYSLGMTVYEVGTFLRYLGADVGLNMDGGGSSTFVLLRQNKAVMLNKQPKNSIRKVGSSIGISIARP